MSKQDTIEALRDQIRKIEQNNHDIDSGVESRTTRSCSCETPFDSPYDKCGDELHLSVSKESNDSEQPHRRDAFSKVVGLINASDKSEAEIRKRLKQSDYLDHEIDEAIEHAQKCGLIDDHRYAHILIRSRLNQGWGSNGIERELIRNNIDPTSINGWPYEYATSDDDQFERALELLRRKPPRSKNIRESAYRKLIQKGYSTSIASRVARVWTEQQINKG